MKRSVLILILVVISLLLWLERKKGNFEVPSYPIYDQRNYIEKQETGENRPRVTDNGVEDQFTEIVNPSEMESGNIGQHDAQDSTFKNLSKKNTNIKERISDQRISNLFPGLESREWILGDYKNDKANIYELKIEFRKNLLTKLVDLKKGDHIRLTKDTQMSWQEIVKGEGVRTMVFQKGKRFLDMDSPKLKPDLPICIIRIANQPYPEILDFTFGSNPVQNVDIIGDHSSGLKRIRINFFEIGSNNRRFWINNIECTIKPKNSHDIRFMEMDVMDLFATIGAKGSLMLKDQIQ